MTKEVLILKLKQLKIFDENSIYFIRYLDLIIANLETKPEKYKTNKHHIIPRCYFKLNKLVVDNSKDNVINLTYTDHLLAHYFLGKCIIDPNLKIAMLRALQYMKVSETNIETITADPEALTWYQNIMIEKAKKHSKRMKGHMPTPWNLGGGDCYTPEQRKKLRDNLVGLHTKYWLNKHLPDEMKSKISKTLTGTHLSEETKQKISNTLKRKNSNKGEKNGMYGTKYMTNGISTIIVKAADIPKYLASGYKFGKLVKLKNLITNDIYWSIEDAATALGITKNKVYKILARKGKGKFLQYEKNW